VWLFGFRSTASELREAKTRPSLNVKISQTSLQHLSFRVCALHFRRVLFDPTPRSTGRKSAAALNKRSAWRRSFLRQRARQGGRLADRLWPRIRHADHAHRQENEGKRSEASARGLDARDGATPLYGRTCGACNRRREERARRITWEMRIGLQRADTDGAKRRASGTMRRLGSLVN
jgi:hypothetical protein